jgi:hypothetical protein
MAFGARNRTGRYRALVVGNIGHSADAGVAN